MTKTCCCKSTDNHKKENQDLLKSVNLKSTKKRSSLINCLRHTDAPLTVEEIHDLLKKEVNINLSTIYRALNALISANIVTRHQLSDGNSAFQLKNEQHQHIISCKVCGKISSVDICPVEDFIDDISKETGYEITDHNLEFIGVCPNCIDNLED